MLDSVDPILVEKQVSAWLGLSLPSLQRMRSNGTGPRFVQLSERRIGYRKSDVQAWLAGRTTDRIGAFRFIDPAVLPSRERHDVPSDALERLPSGKTTDEASTQLHGGDAQAGRSHIPCERAPDGALSKSRSS